MKVIGLVALILSTPAFARQELARYSWMVKEAIKDEKQTPKNAVYVWPWVKIPGSYKFKKGMTVAQLVTAAGGLKLDDRYPNIPDIQRPKTISVYRPTSEEKDPNHSMYRCKLEWEKPEAGVGACDFVLKKGDLVMVSMSPTVP